MRLLMLALALFLWGACAPPAMPTPPHPTPAPTAVSSPGPALSPTATPLPGPTPEPTATPSFDKLRTPLSSPTPSSGPGVTLTGPSGEALRLPVELAFTPEEMARGLSKRERLPEGAGMLFVFPGETRTPFWMKDTYIALSIAFIAGDGTIVDLQDMEPLSEELHYPRAPYRYALEVNRGLFARHGIRVGDRVGLPPAAR